jgi:ABC-type sugar transport system ATPase subunit
MAEVSLRKVVKRYDEVEAVRGIDLDIADHEFVVLVGPSGCGKSTTLRMIAGLEDITDGDIAIGGDIVNDVPPKDRDIAMVFQNYALYPHMTVAENMSFGLRLKHYPKAEIKSRVAEAARMLDITDLVDRKPKQLSGGQRQRVAMGRAIVRNPKVFLFDEPLSNLDAKLRVQMRIEIKKVHQKVRTTTVYVTHDQVEAMTLADRVVVMNGGRIEQIGTPQEVYDAPRSRFVARFIGGSNVVDATHLGGNQVEVAGRPLMVGLGEFAGPGRPMSFCVKTHDVELVPEGQADGGNALPGIVRSHAYLGSHRDYVVDVGQELLIAAPVSLELAPGSPVAVRFRAEHCRGLVQ